MEKKTTAGSQNGKKLIFFGLISIGILFLIYSKFENPSLTPDAISSIERLAVVFYILLVISFNFCLVSFSIKSSFVNNGIN